MEANTVCVCAKGALPGKTGRKSFLVLKDWGGVLKDVYKAVRKSDEGGVL